MIYDIWTVFWRDWVVLKRRLPKFIFSRMVAPMMYLVAFGWGLGRYIEMGDGISYLDFLVPGILALNSMNISFNSIIPIHAEKVYHKSLEQYLLAPINRDSFIIGKILSAVLRASISSCIILILAYAFGATIEMSLEFILVLILNCMIFAEIGFFAAMKINTYEEMSQVNLYILLPMSFLCGTFFRTATLPDAVRIIIDALPLTHTCYLLRGISLGYDVSELSVLVLGLYVVAVYLMCCYSFRELTK